MKGSINTVFVIKMMGNDLRPVLNYQTIITPVLHTNHSKTQLHDLVSIPPPTSSTVALCLIHKILCGCCLIECMCLQLGSGSCQRLLRQAEIGSFDFNL